MFLSMSAQVSEGSGTNDTTDEPSSQTPGRRAKDWEHFEHELVVVEGVPKAVCKYCKLKLTYTNKIGTNSLRNHIAESCLKIQINDRNRFVATVKKQPSEASFIFDPQRTRELITKFSIHAEIPFQKFDNPYFKEWMESMQSFVV